MNKSFKLKQEVKQIGQHKIEEQQKKEGEGELKEKL